MNKEKNRVVYIVIDYDNCIRILKGQKIKEKQVVFFKYEDKTKAFDDMYKTFSISKIDEFAMLEFTIDEFKYDLIKSNLNIQSLIKNATLKQNLVFTEINIEEEKIDLKEVEYSNKKEKMEVIEYLTQRKDMIEKLLNKK